MEVPDACTGFLSIQVRAKTGPFILHGKSHHFIVFMTLLSKRHGGILDGIIAKCHSRQFCPCTGLSLVYKRIKNCRRKWHTIFPSYVYTAG